MFICEYHSFFILAYPFYLDIPSIDIRILMSFVLLLQLQFVAESLQGAFFCSADVGLVVAEVAAVVDLVAAEVAAVVVLVVAEVAAVVDLVAAEVAAVVDLAVAEVAAVVDLVVAEVAVLPRVMISPLRSFDDAKNCDQ